MVPRRVRVSDDSGFSLSELLIVAALLVLVVSLAWTLASVVNEGSQVSEGIGVGARETGQPLQLAERYVMQALAIEESGPYRLVYRIDRDIATASTGERHVLEATADGELTLTVVPIDQALAPTGSAQTSTLLTHSVNVAQAHPVFRYYDGDGVEITDMGSAPSDTRRIRIGVEVEEHDQVHSDSRLVTLRNRE